jgi:hypothetical protein
LPAGFFLFLLTHCDRGFGAPFDFDGELPAPTPGDGGLAEALLAAPGELVGDALGAAEALPLEAVGGALVGAGEPLEGAALAELDAEALALPLLDDPDDDPPPFFAATNFESLGNAMACPRSTSAPG